jgi:hypothetical protein
MLLYIWPEVFRCSQLRTFHDNFDTTRSMILAYVYCGSTAIPIMTFRLLVLRLYYRWSGHWQRVYYYYNSIAVFG